MSKEEYLTMVSEGRYEITLFQDYYNRNNKKPHLQFNNEHFVNWSKFQNTNRIIKEILPFYNELFNVSQTDVLDKEGKLIKTIYTSKNK